MKNTIIVIGAGCAGMIAALMAQAEGASVVLIDRNAIGLGTNSALSAGRFTAPNTHYHPDEYIQNTLDTGRGINSEMIVRIVAHEAPHAFSRIRSLGLELGEHSRGYFIKPSRPVRIPGVPLVKKLAEMIKNSHSIEVLPWFYVTEILKDEGKVCGVEGFGKTGKRVARYAQAVVLATGGAGALYLRNDNQKSTMGQGYYLAARSGLALWDMEFIQFYPFVIAEPGLPSLLLYPPRPPGARVINAAGEDILAEYGIRDLNEAIMRKRDESSAILFQKGLQETMFMDCQRTPDSFWQNHTLSMLKFDFSKRPFAISPAAHFLMGGVRIDETGQTSLPGLFACGEVTWGLHGANRMAGNALTECFVVGSIAGRNAAQYAHNNPLPEQDSRKLPEEDISDHRSPTQMALRDLRQRIRETAWIHAGVVRSEQGLSEGLSTLKALEGQLREITPQSVREKTVKQDLMSAAFVLKAVLHASMARCETRGSFIHKDFPQQDDLNWRKNSSLTYDRERDSFSLTHHEAG